MAAAKAPHPAFPVWESATGVPQSAAPGLLPARCATPLTTLLGLALLVPLYPVLGLAAIPAAVVFARLAALDLTTYTLPDIYTVPLLAMGLAHALNHGHAPQAFLAISLAAASLWLLSRLRPKAGFGGGDLKLLAALLAFIPLPLALPALAAGCLMYLPVTFLKPQESVPFGVPILAGWVLALAMPDLPNRLFSTIW